MMGNYKVIERSPSYEEYRKLCISVGRDYMNFEVAQEALDNSIYSIVVIQNEEVVGMARIVGDGEMYFYF
jgi:hypothetical protein